MSRTNYNQEKTLTRRNVNVDYASKRKVYKPTARNSYTSTFGSKATQTALPKATNINEIYNQQSTASTKNKNEKIYTPKAQSKKPHEVKSMNNPSMLVDAKNASKIAKKANKQKVTKKKKESSNPEKRLKIEDHLNELRRRLVFCVVSIILGATIGYRFQDEIVSWLVQPLNQQLFYTTPMGGFDFLIKICVFFGLLLAVPFIIFNFIKFISPAMPQDFSYSTIKILFTSTLLAVAGVSFAYFISLPAALHFLNSFTNEHIQSLISAQEYFNFVMIYLAGFAILFQMPLIFIFINRVTPLKPSSLIKKQRLVILFSFILAAFLTPTPDPFNQTIMAIPMIGLYNASVGVVWRDNKKQSRKRAKKGKPSQSLVQSVA